jgi:catechol 2,3-dioxygenase-like lactoylglutathione lyase family enzyme
VGGITAIPVLRVADFESALRFYRDLLGFEVGFRHDDYISLQHGTAVLHLTTPKYGKPPGAGTVYLIRDEVDQYFGSIRARGGAPDTEPADQFYGMREFVILDPDGNRLLFGCNLD